MIRALLLLAASAAAFGCAQGGLTLANQSDTGVIATVRGSEGVMLRSESGDASPTLGPTQIEPREWLTFSASGAPKSPNAPVARIVVRPVVSQPGEQYVYEVYAPMPGRLEVIGGPGALRFRLPKTASQTMLPGNPVLNERRAPRPGQVRP